MGTHKQCIYQSTIQYLEFRSSKFFDFLSNVWSNSFFLWTNQSMNFNTTKAIKSNKRISYYLVSISSKSRSVFCNASSFFFNLESSFLHWFAHSSILAQKHTDIIEWVERLLHFDVVIRYLHWPHIEVHKSLVPFLQALYFFIFFSSWCFCPSQHQLNLPNSENKKFSLTTNFHPLSLTSNWFKLWWELIRVDEN